MWPMSYPVCLVATKNKSGQTSVPGEYCKSLSKHISNQSDSAAFVIMLSWADDYASRRFQLVKQFDILQKIKLGWDTRLSWKCP